MRTDPTLPRHSKSRSRDSISRSSKVGVKLSVQVASLPVSELANKPNLTVGGVKLFPGNARTNATFVRGEGSTEAKLLSRRLQSDDARHGNQTPAHLALSRYDL